MPEWEGCEKPIIEALVAKGWRYVQGSDLPRSTDEVIIKPYLREFVEKNARKMGIEITDDIFNRLLFTLQGRAGLEGLKDTLHHLKNGFVFLDIKGRGLVPLNIIDYEQIEKNSFVVSNQVTYLTPDGREKRLDVVLFVNGIPIAAVECKNPVGAQTWYDAFKQLRNYEKSLPDLFRFVQINAAIGAKARVYATMPWIDDDSRIKTQKWGIGDFDEMNGVVSLLSPETLLDVLKNFIFIYQFRGGTYKLMPRFMQYRAVKAIYRHAMDGKGGVIWHWQGSGKTLTMIFAAYKLYRDERLEKPTIFFVMDRRELQEQFFEFLCGIDFGGIILVDRVRSVADLERILRFDSGRGKRGFFVILIQKFKERGGIDLEEIEKLGIVERKNIFVFVDEAHRTQYGILAARMKRALRNAKFFAFTGTPLLRSDKNTFREFGVILDKYFIEESVKDGYTVPIIYTFAKERGVHLNEGELRRIVDELVPEGEEGEIIKRLRPTREFMKNEARMRKIAKGVVDDLIKNRTYKGMLVAVDREACVLYRKYIMEYLRKEYPEIYEKYGEEFVEVVMTYNPGEDIATIYQYREEIEKRYGMAWEDVNKKLRDDFRDEEKKPRLIIVTDMLLTGYDVPVLEVMYLDKIMTGHGLLQAIARTNRPYREKGFGVVIDYVGIFRIFRDTLRKYYEIEDTDAEKAALSVEILRQMLDESIRKLCKSFVVICTLAEKLERADRDALYAALYDIERENKEGDLEKMYRELNRIWRALGGDPVKAEPNNLRLFRAVSAVYILYHRMHRKPVPPEILETVRRLGEEIRKLSTVRSMQRGRELVIDTSFLNDLERRGRTKEAVVDMTAVLSTFIATVRGDAVRETIYGDVVEYIENAINRWKERKSSLAEIYNEEMKALQSIIEENKKMASSKITPVEYAMIKLIHSTLGWEETPQFVEDMISSLREKELLFPGWFRKRDVMKQVRAEIRKSLLKYMASHNQYDPELLGELVERIIKLLPFLEGS